MEQKESINLAISDGEPFFAHEVSVNFNPMQFILDFRCITPRNDPRTKGRPSLNLKHNVVMVDPWHMVQLRDLFGRMTEAYEKEFGKIKKPKAVETFEKKHKKPKESKEESKTEVPSYFG
jgi:hypothetical protein